LGEGQGGGQARPYVVQKVTLLSASQLKLSYGDVEIFSGVDLEVAERARIGVVGPNGGGKTSLLRVLVGEMEPSGGAVSRAEGLRIGYVPQVATQAAGGSLKDEVMQAFVELRRLEDELAGSAMEIQWAEDKERRQAERRYSSLLERYEALGGYDYQNRMERVATGVGLSAETLDTPFAVASGGERTRAALARALLAEPDLLALDEPTNYLDFKGLAWLETFLGRFTHAFIVVSHDRYFLDRVVEQIWELDNGRLKRFPGNYTKYRKLKAEQLARQQVEYERQQEYIARQKDFIQRYGVGQRAREARGREKKLAHLERIEAPKREQTVHIGGVAASRTGQVALSTHDLKVGFFEDGRSVELLNVPDLKLERGARVAIIGPNGIGKTTLLRTLLGIAQALEGSVRLGYNVKPGYYRQGHDDLLSTGSRETLPQGPTVLDALLDIRNLPVGEARSYLARFLFRGDDVFKPVSALSGGERSRLALARLLVAEPNVLALDEPTTHLDIPSREALEQVLLAYEGAIIFVSHDRHLISLLAQQLWVLEDGAVLPFEGTFEEWAQSTHGNVEAYRYRRGVQQYAPTPLQYAPTPPKQTKPAARRSVAAPQKGPPAEPKPDPEQIITELEAALRDIEQGLASASERQDVEEIARLGQEYDETRARLDAAWDAWGK
jgi:ATP-binding cassette subfamily F protein 3